MAINYKDLKNKLETDPLTEEELQWIQDAEDFIDASIMEHFGNPYYDVSIDEAVVKFNWSPKDKKEIKVRSARRGVMYKELENRYRKAGWTIAWSNDIDCNYATFRGKI